MRGAIYVIVLYVHQFAYLVYLLTFLKYPCKLNVVTSLRMRTETIVKYYGINRLNILYTVVVMSSTNKCLQGTIKTKFID